MTQFNIRIFEHFFFGPNSGFVSIFGSEQSMNKFARILKYFGHGSIGCGVRSPRLMLRTQLPLFVPHSGSSR